jgi:hypothetical protein
MCLSHTIHHQNVTIAAMIIIMLIYGNIRNPNNLVKCVMKHLRLGRMSKDFIKSQNITLPNINIG